MHKVNCVLSDQNSPTNLDSSLCGRTASDELVVLDVTVEFAASTGVEAV